MHRPVCAAVLAAAEEGVCSAMPGLLASADIALDALARDGHSALEAVLLHQPELLVADVHLPQLDGCSLARRLLTGDGASYRPRILLLCRREFPVPGRVKLEEMGAGFLCWPAGRADFAAAVDGLGSAAHFSDARMRRIDRLLNELGVPAHSGRECLKYAALLCAEDARLLHGRGRELYPRIAALLDMDAAGVERAMRYVIGAAWQSDQFENQYRIFADTVDAGRGQPTCGEMIARLADILRLEG